MSHVDDGLLHAYMDGALLAEDPARAADVEAHLAVCQDCQARLRQAETLKAEADALLELAVPPAAKAPDFGEIEARAEAEASRGSAGTASADSQQAAPTSARHPRPASVAWTRRLAWAASVVIALGMGWWARELAYAPDSPLLETQAAPTERSRAAREAAGTPEATDAEDEASTRPANVIEAAPAPGAAAAEEEPAGAGVAGRAQGAAPTQEAAPAQDAVSDVAAALEPPVEPETAPALAEAAPSPEPAARAAAEAPMARARRQELEPLNVTGHVAPAAKVESQAAPEATLMDRQEPLALNATVVTGVPGPPAETLERWLGGPLWGIEGLVHLERDTLNIGGVAAVRIRQALRGGGTVELLELRADAGGRTDAAVRGYLSGVAARKAAGDERQAAPAAAPAPAGSVTLDPGAFGGTTIIATAALPADSLRSLLQRLERLP